MGNTPFPASPCSHGGRGPYKQFLYAGRLGQGKTCRRSGEAGGVDQGKKSVCVRVGPWLYIHIFLWTRAIGYDPIK